MVLRISLVKDVDVEHIPGIINPSDIFTKETKDNIHFRNIRDSMMVSLQEFMKHSHNDPSHIISSEKLLPYYSIWSEHIVTANLELQSGVPEHIIPEILELQSRFRQTV